MLPSATSFEIITFLLIHWLLYYAVGNVFYSGIASCYIKNLWFLFLFLGYNLYPCDHFQKKEWFTDDAANSTIECINTSQTRHIILVPTKINMLDEKEFHDIYDRGWEIWKQYSSKSQINNNLIDAFW